MEDNNLEDLINNILNNPKLYNKLNKEQLIEVLKYCLSDIKSLKIETERLNKLYDKDKIEKIDQFYNDIFLNPIINEAGEEEYKSKIECFNLKYKDILNISTRVEEKSEDINKSYDELYKKVPIQVEQDDGTFVEEESLIRDYINMYVERITNINIYEKQLTDIIEKCNDQKISIDNSTTNYTTTYNSLQKQFKDIKSKIENLLPGATTAGLASAFRNAKLLYKKTESISNVTNKDQTKISKVIQFTKSTIPYINNAIKFLALYLVFLAPLIVIVWQGYSTLETLNLTSTNDWIKILIKAPLSIPLIYISLFGHRAIRERHEMYEEYHHKQRIMEIYEGISREISNLVDETSDEEEKNEVMKLKKDLLDTLLQTVKNNPSEILFNRYKTNKATKKDNQNVEKLINKAVDIIKK